MENNWFGYPMETGTFDGMDTVCVFPKGERCGYLAVKTEYWGAFPEAVELSLLEKGFCLCSIQNTDRWGTEENIHRKAAFIRHVCRTYGLREKVVPVGMSCGGLIAIQLAARYPELIACLYLDAPVLNYLSCPCGLGAAEPLDGGNGIGEMLGALKLDGISQLIGYRDMPLDKLPALIRHRIPVVMVAGGQDHTVPYSENGHYLEQAYRASGIDFALYLKPQCDHHPHGLADNRPVIDFIVRHCPAEAL